MFVLQLEEERQDYTLTSLVLYLVLLLFFYVLSICWTTAGLMCCKILTVHVMASMLPPPS